MNIKVEAFKRVQELDAGSIEGVGVDILADDPANGYSIVRLDCPDGLVLYEVLRFDHGEFPWGLIEKMLIKADVFPVVNHPDRLIFVVAKLGLRTKEADGSTQEKVPAQRKPALELQPLP